MPESCMPFLMFTGQASEALDFYVETFTDARVESVENYGEGEQMPPTAVKAAIFTVAGQRIRAFDSPPVHAFTFTPSISFFVECADEDEIRTLAAKLADEGGVMMPLNSYGFSTLFAWVADRFGVSWQLNLA